MWFQSPRFEGRRILRFCLNTVIPILSYGIALGIYLRPVSGFSEAATSAWIEQDEHPDFPDGKGREETLRTCGRCHSVSNIPSHPQDKGGWQATIEKMQGLGATGTDEEFGALLDYVTTNFPLPTAGPRVNLNKGAASELSAKLGLSAKDAAAIVNYRSKNGAFTSIADLKKVSGIDTSIVDVKKGLIDF